MSRLPAASSKAIPINLDDKTRKEDELGTLIVVLLKARNLPDKHSFRKSDVFAQATLNGAQKRTHVDIKGGQRPEWDVEVRFKVMKNAATNYRKLEVECYSQEPRSEDLMGKGVVDIAETIRTGEFDDWVPLEVDGVVRGELYLEMTYYANAAAPSPQQAAAPNKLLSSIMNQNGGLSRRPSKLSPNDRLSRPQHQLGRPAAQPTNIQPQGYAGRPSAGPSRPSGLSHQRHSSGHEDPMPGAYPMKNDVQGHSPHSGSPVQRLDIAAALPTSLRPGSAAPPASRPQQIRHTSDPRSANVSSSASTADLSQNPYISTSPSSNPYISPAVGASLHPPALAPTRTYSPAPSSVNPNGTSGTAVVSAGQQYVAHGLRPTEQRPSGTPILWQDSGNFGASPQSNGAFFFPSPVGPQTPTAQRQEIPGLHYSQYQSSSLDDRLRADPYLQTRYQTPLPLPPGAERPAPAAPTPSSEQRPSYTRVPTPPQKVNTPLPDSGHLERLRRAEEVAAQRRAQELRDLELAMQLDRELNL
ncbi:hypothetical protein D9619_004463 [Psilocybe cf. subviscida]|uniref:C2 domain-containing protein n=1 Tax=Psilocybe cf. subviscida TaxID=2480587 RepID=A0A8H5F899_9AGAR|nr:hypothetical protein D9619_004463 [Psilocybe cf. subviscida]